ncbi:MAG: chloride channel protein [Candidatus Krumholzibacteriota bacterium]|nr:chloride channel protein [Candidatus Krumholzibacteriota bacterium]
MDKFSVNTIGKFSGMIILSVLAGISGAVIVEAFTSTLKFISKYTDRADNLWGFLLPVAGAFILGSLILRYHSDAGHDGIPSYIKAINQKGGKFSTPATLLKIPATLLTLGLCGSGGIVGPLSRIGAGISSLIYSKVLTVFKIRHEEALRAAAICGMSGIISAIFLSPLGGAFFAVEILSKRSLKYSDLFPSILAGVIAVITSFSLGLEPVFRVHAAPFRNDLYILMLLPLAGIISSAAGLLFITIFDKISDLFQSISARQPFPVLLSCLTVSVLWLSGAKAVLGTSMPLFRIFAGGSLEDLSLLSINFGNIPLIIISFVILKIMVTSLTVGSGMSGGLTAPILIIGAGCGAFLCSISGIEPGSSAYYAVIVSCISGILASGLNIPIASILISAAIFGHSYTVPAIIGAILPFLLFKEKTVFKYLKADEEEDSEGEITRRDEAH